MRASEKINTSLRIDKQVYYHIKEISPQGNVNNFINKAISKYLAELEKKELALAYQRANVDKEIAKEMKEIEGTIEDGIAEI
jgi:hypothetical protein